MGLKLQKDLKFQNLKISIIDFWKLENFKKYDIYLLRRYNIDGNFALVINMILLQRQPIQVEFNTFLMEGRCGVESDFSDQLIIKFCTILHLSYCF